MKPFFRFIFSKLFFKQLFLAITIVVLLFLTTVIGLRIFTRHGKTILVPDVHGYNEAQVSRVIARSELRFEIIDSIYTEEVLPGTVFDQIPAAGSFVKKDRKIFLVLNAVQGEMVAVPSFSNVSLRQAKVLIAQKGLKLGRVTYVSSEYKDLVISQFMDGKVIEAGGTVRKFSTIDLHVGRGLASTKTLVPYLRGMYLVDALRIIEKSNLNKGSMINDDTIEEESPKDSTIVWKQYPQPQVSVSQGKAVDLWLTMDTAVVYAADTTLQLR